MGASVEFRCNYGYAIPGTAGKDTIAVTCQSDLQWSVPTQACQGAWLIRTSVI